MLVRGLRVVEDLSDAAWLAPALTGGFGSVTGTVPSGYSAYVRICHPVLDGAVKSGYVGRGRARDRSVGASADAMACAFSPRELGVPRVELPARSYLLLAGTLDQAMQIDWPPFRQSPNLFWPADRAWCVATELDFDSTLVACSEELARGLLDARSLDAWRVQPDDSLRHDADQINATRTTGS